MVGKNNQEVLNKKTGRQVNRYGFRRLSVGVASVAVAGLLFASNIALVQAAEGVGEPTTVETTDAGTVAGAEEVPTEGTPATEEIPEVEEPEEPEAFAEKPAEHEGLEEEPATPEAEGFKSKSIEAFSAVKDVHSLKIKKHA